MACITVVDGRRIKERVCRTGTQETVSPRWHWFSVRLIDDRGRAGDWLSRKGVSTGRTRADTDAKCAAIVGKQGEKCRHVTINQSLCRAEPWLAHSGSTSIHRLGHVEVCRVPCRPLSDCLTATATASACLMDSFACLFINASCFHAPTNQPFTQQGSLHQPSYIRTNISLADEYITYRRLK